MSDDRATRQPSPVFVELYKLTVEMADRVSARRGTANSFFFTLHAAFVAIIGFVRPMKSSDAGAASSTAAAAPPAVEQVDTFGLIYVAVAPPLGGSSSRATEISTEPSSQSSAGWRRCFRPNRSTTSGKC